MSFIDLREYLADVILDDLLRLLHHHPAAPALEDNAIDLHFAFLAAGAEHGEFMGPDKIVHGLVTAGALAYPASGCRFANLFRHTARIVSLRHPADRIGGPIIGRWVTVGVKNLGL